jgi:hypothetical protein
MLAAVRSTSIARKCSRHAASGSIARMRRLCVSMTAESIRNFRAAEQDCDRKKGRVNQRFIIALDRR